MRPRIRSLRGPIVLASLLVLAGVGYAAYSATASVTVTVNTASFSLIYTAITDPPLPANIVTFQAVGLPSANPTLYVATLLAGQVIEVNYTVEDVGTIAAHNVVEEINELATNCDGDLVLAQIGTGPTYLSPDTPVTAAFTITDNAAPGPVPLGCPDPFTAVWHFSVTGTPV